MASVGYGGNGKSAPRVALVLSYEMPGPEAPEPEAVQARKAVPFLLKAAAYSLAELRRGSKRRVTVPYDVTEATVPEAIPSVEDEVEGLVLRGVHCGELEWARRRVVEGLRTAMTSKSGDVPAWLSAAGRLRATAALDSVEQALDQAFPPEVQFAAVDAARAVALDSGTGPRARVAERLEALADRLRPSSPFVAARALLGVVILRGLDGWQALLARMPVWSPRLLELAMGAVERQILAVPPADRSGLPAAPALRAAAIGLACRLEEPADDDVFARADALRIAALLWSAGDPAEVVALLVAAHRAPQAVLRGAAVLGTRILGRERPRLLVDLMATEGGEALVSAALKVHQSFAGRSPPR